MAFSGAVKIGDLNDFIAPSQACGVSLQGGKLEPAADAEVRICFYALSLPPPLPAARLQTANWCGCWPPACSAAASQH